MLGQLPNRGLRRGLLETLELREGCIGLRLGSGHGTLVRRQAVQIRIPVALSLRVGRFGGCLLSTLGALFRCLSRAASRRDLTTLTG